MAEMVIHKSTDENVPWYELNEDVVALILLKLSNSWEYWDQVDEKTRGLAADFVSISMVNRQLHALEIEACKPRRIVLTKPLSPDYINWLSQRADQVLMLEFKWVREESFQSAEQLAAFLTLIKCCRSLEYLKLENCSSAFCSWLLRVAALLSNKLTTLLCVFCDLWEDYEGVRAIATSCTKLKDIQISYYGLDAKPLPEDIAIALGENCPELRSIEFSAGVLDLKGLLALLDKCKSLIVAKISPMSVDYELFLGQVGNTHVANTSLQTIELYLPFMSLTTDLVPLLRLCPGLEYVVFEMDPSEIGRKDEFGEEFHIEGNTLANYEKILDDFPDVIFIDRWHNDIEPKDWFR